MKRQLQPKRTNLKQKRVTFTTLVKRLGPHSISPKADLKALYNEHKGRPVNRQTVKIIQNQGISTPKKAISILGKDLNH